MSVPPDNTRFPVSIPAEMLDYDAVTHTYTYWAQRQKTSCKSCGAPLSSTKCDYCGADAHETFFG